MDKAQALNLTGSLSQKTHKFKIGNRREMGRCGGELKNLFKTKQEGIYFCRFTLGSLWSR